MKFLYKAAIASSIILLLTLLMTHPQELPSWALIFPFGLLFVILTAGIFALLSGLGMGRKSAFEAGLAGAAAPVILLVLQSLGQLTFRDALVIFALFGLVYFYVMRLTARTSP